ncbi:MAG: FHA domain-containing protein [Planctomycetaceae bacterium]|jgi:pSer/pThr/pTyr-binding forkhead associated (FHA) protein|nr:FHA domain-containing protein [Planctomycetaceae bacterium]MDG2389861.1 FHA domain-containing protein [Planctomycetaceae bacterium]
MTNITEKITTLSSDILEVTQEFFENCGGDPKYQLSCLNLDTKEVEFFPVETPCLLLGRGSDCDLRLKQRDISYRHVYLQMLNQRLLVVDLGSRAGTQWSGSRRRSGWLLPGRDIQVGNYKIRLVKWDQSEEASAEDGESDISLKAVLETDSKPFPNASLELLSAKNQSPTGRSLILKPGVTLIGRSRIAQIRLKHDSVSHVHSSLVLTSEGLWVVDLLGRDGTSLNGDQIKFARLQSGDVINVGAFHLRVETSLMKSSVGVMNTLHLDQSSFGDSRLGPDAGGSSVVQSRSESSDLEGADFDHSDADIPILEDEATVMDEGDDSARWSDIINALKTGGFGS